MRTARQASLLALAAGSLLAACAGGYEVVRVQDGRATAGRFVSEVAYAASLEAAIAEERGDWTRAVELLRRARDEDPSPELTARLGIALCQTGRLREGLAATLGALGSDPTLERAWTARARCRLLAAKTPGERADARQDLEQAIGCDADALEPVLLLIDLEIEAGELARARLRAEEAATLHPHSGRVFRALARLAARQGDAARAVQAALTASTLDAAAGAEATAVARDAADRAGLAGASLRLRGLAAPTGDERARLDAYDTKCRSVVEAFGAIVARGDDAEVAAAADGARARCPAHAGELELAELAARWSPATTAELTARAASSPWEGVRRLGARLRLRSLALEALLADGALPQVVDRETLGLELAARALRDGEDGLATAATILAPTEPTVARLCAARARAAGRDAKDPARIRACALARTDVEKAACP